MRRAHTAAAEAVIRPTPPAFDGVPDPGMLTESAATIAATQTASGAIPWEIDGESMGRIDAWDHVECAMALTAYGPSGAAERAFTWLAGEQRPDGSLPREWLADMTGHVPGRTGGGDTRPRVKEPMTDTNMTAYLAVGVWHHWLTRGDRGFVDAMWPSVRAALDLVCRLQLPFGGIAWAVDRGRPAREALIAGSSSIHHALRCGVMIAALVGREARGWEGCADRLAEALIHREDGFAPKTRFAMDWYYPVLGGVLRGEAGARRIANRWADFVVPGVGVRCVDDHPWVTAAESNELALACAAVGLWEQAEAVVESVQHLRATDGAYHTGYVFADGKRWPGERSTWTAAAVILAADALSMSPRGGNVFGLPSRVARPPAVAGALDPGDGRLGPGGGRTDRHRFSAVPGPTV